MLDEQVGDFDRWVLSGCESGIASLSKVEGDFVSDGTCFGYRPGQMGATESQLFVGAWGRLDPFYHSPLVLWLPATSVLVDESAVAKLFAAAEASTKAAIVGCDLAGVSGGRTRLFSPVGVYRRANTALSHAIAKLNHAASFAAQLSSIYRDCVNTPLVRDIAAWEDLSSHARVRAAIMGRYVTETKPRPLRAVDRRLAETRGVAPRTPGSMPAGKGTPSVTEMHEVRRHVPGEGVAGILRLYPEASIVYGYDAPDLAELVMGVPS